MSLVDGSMVNSSASSAEISGTKSRRRSRSSSWSLSEMPRTGPALMRFIRWVVKPAIYGFEGEERGGEGSGHSSHPSGGVRGVPPRGGGGGGDGSRREKRRAAAPSVQQSGPWQRRVAGSHLVAHALRRHDSDLVNNALVGVEVEGETGVVLLHDHAAVLLDGLGTDSHGGGGGRGEAEKGGGGRGWS
uniref:Uncharacterized protein n=1 Tax=Florenciella parvula TaxID=236787 RepID=A0A7S2CHY6_9STRA|mmetsp:Transcript_29331/g.60105  ORF Transcript_29331/g.60105 Transcript_29331/m.60105 type:complete len:188 (+) Transcript_29331:147-710(+)